MEASLEFMSIISSHYFDSKRKFIYYMVLIKSIAFIWVCLS